MRRSVPLRVGIIEIRDGQRIEQARTELAELGVTNMHTDRLRQVGRGVRDRAEDESQLCGGCARGNVAIAGNGEVWPCVFARWLPVGNVRRTILKDIVTGPVLTIALLNVPKPVVLGRYEWDEKDTDEWGECINRAELLTLVTDRICSTTQELRADLDLPDRWWVNLRASLDHLAGHATERPGADQEQIDRSLLAYFGSGVDPSVRNWTTAHGDLNWTNLTRPNLILLDWESWGVRMAGYDAATLYVLSLLVPDTAKKVHDTFADILDGPDGTLAQLFVITRYLKRVEHGDFPDYADHLHRHARRLMS